MVELIPIMLFILGYDPETPDVIYFERVPIIFADVAACEADATARIAEMQAESARRQHVTYSFECVPLPEREEFDAMLERLTPERLSD